MFVIFNIPIIFLLTACSFSEPKPKGIDGEFIAPMLQHPIVYENQHYFKPKGSSYSEWIAVTKGDVKTYTPATVYGTVDGIELGGDKATKMSYGNAVIHIDKIEYHSK